MNKHILSVIIPVYEDHLRFGMMIQTLLQHKCSNSFEIIVINDGGSDKIYKDLLNYKHLMNPNIIGLQYHWLGPHTTDFRAAATRNIGIKAAIGKRVLFLDCDTVPARGCIDAHMGAAGHALVGLRRHIPEHHFHSLISTDVSLDWYEQHVETEDIRTRLPFSTTYQALPGGDAPHTVFWSCNVSMPIKSIVDIGGFDESYVGWGGEDEDLAIRLIKTGMEIHRTDGYVYHLDHQPRTSIITSKLLQITRLQSIIRNDGPLQPIPQNYL